jgi:prepilin-type N-terminal cleavage/methylation domain-containing protein
MNEPTDAIAVSAFPGSDSTPRSRAGFSLLEVMAALAILAVGILATTAGQVTALKHSADSRGSMLAMYLAEAQMEVFRTMVAADVVAMTTAGTYPNDPNNPIDPVASDDVVMEFNRRWTIQPDTPEAGVITITVEVDWVNSLGIVRTARVQGLKAG